jgi:ankyrin repeat protein
VQLLLNANVNVTHQDATGDNALHWAARNSHLDVVKYLCRKSESAVLAVVAENFQREKPTDVARKKFEKKETTATTEIYGILLNSLKVRAPKYM